MSLHPTHLPQATDDDSYEDLLSLWSDLESGLALVLGNPFQVQEFIPKMHQYELWMQALLEQDTDASLYLLFQLASTSTRGYSSSHALVCGALCHITATALALPTLERTCLVRAAMTMNIGMTALQDTLALQKDRPSKEQQAAINSHAARGRLVLEALGVQDVLWLDTVAEHHSDIKIPGTGIGQLPPAARLAHMLRTVDRYAALISPRQSRPGGSATDSAKAITAAQDDVSPALIQVVGLTPPGTFVRLNTGDIAVVLRRRGADNLPLVATVMDAHGEPIRPPRLQLARNTELRIQAGMARSSVPLDLDHRTMVRLGIFAASRPAGGSTGRKD